MSYGPRKRTPPPPLPKGYAVRIPLHPNEYARLREHALDILRALGPEITGPKGDRWDVFGLNAINGARVDWMALDQAKPDPQRSLWEFVALNDVVFYECDDLSFYGEPRPIVATSEKPTRFWVALRHDRAIQIVCGAVLLAVGPWLMVFLRWAARVYDGYWWGVLGR
jgi:hypothetical protein